jgi:YD repeat-containing protein
MTGTTDRNGRVTSSAYDALGRNISVTVASGNTTASVYDAAGNKIALTDANGHTTNYVYDAGNRLVSEILPDASAIHYTYNGVNLPVSRVDNNGNTTVYEYDIIIRIPKTTTFHLTRRAECYPPLTIIQRSVLTTTMPTESFPKHSMEEPPPIP